MSNRFTKENYDNIQRLVESKTGVTLSKQQNRRKYMIPARAAVAVAICLTLTCATVFASDEGQALIQKLFFNKPVESEIISYGYEEPHRIIVANNDVSGDDPVSTVDEARGSEDACDEFIKKEEISQSEALLVKEKETADLKDETTTVMELPGHKGLDIVADRGTPVYPVLAGKVIESDYNATNGNYIVIEHAEGYKSKYAHLDDRLVEVGQEVTIEMQIGTVGSTGMSTGPHLHLEMMLNGELIDPSPYIFE